MLKYLKYLFSYVWPSPIFIGYSDTIKDNEQARVKLFKDLFNRRVHRNTIKYLMEPDFALYELVQVTKDPKSQVALYQLHHCATGHLMTVDETVFNILFKREG